MDQALGAFLAKAFLLSFHAHWACAMTYLFLGLLPATKNGTGMVELVKVESTI